jgi:hypothetical protein
MKITSNENFSEFMRFCSKDLNPFKIQTSFKLDLILEFIIQNTEIFGSWDKNKTCSISIYLPPYQILNILDIGKIVICIFEV